ncbi:NUDIX hydrolase [Allobranchiibius huperziae]|uniref:8-oxo-dGTP pyrophosphatase MutT (NUDIX family) n=1 Tax=Allobranchiibius huperziae TaxID=1874116 RepID=A0A853DGR6_9MICO|nr:NUDIX hydrolase [Allobranchiibius huperziae]NYJ73395.1 8-oxo-dGTP pyrophosphatase MutT (NUDIX family) [Allobranchiibius huperziae]
MAERVTGSVVPTREQVFVAGGPVGELARLWLDAGSPAGVPPRRASTVMVLRHGRSDGGPEVFMLRRVASMAFAPSMWVFPGGGVDPRDADVDVPWAGPTPQEWAVRLGVPREEAVELVCAAVREVFEECGVLLAGRAADEVLADVTGPTWQGHRAALLAKGLSMSQLLSHEGLVLRSDLLSFQDHWLTPEFEKRRYDTYFFAALLPEGQRADDQTSEADISRWVTPADLIADVASGEASMLAPTVTNLERLDQASGPEVVIASTPPVVPVMPVAEYDGARVVLRARLPIR